MQRFYGTFSLFCSNLLLIADWLKSLRIFDFTSFLAGMRYLRLGSSFRIKPLDLACIPFALRVLSAQRLSSLRASHFPHPAILIVHEAKEGGKGRLSLLSSSRDELRRRTTTCAMLQNFHMMMTEWICFVEASWGESFSAPSWRDGR